MPSRTRTSGSLVAAASAAILALVQVGCTTDVAGPNSPPFIRGAAATPNAYSVLSSVVTFNAPVGDSARVISVASGDSSATPFVELHSFSQQQHIVTLGLLPSTTYTQTIQVKNLRGQLATTNMQFTTGPLPSYVARAQLTQTAGTFSGGGYTLVSPITYAVDTALAVAFDSANRVRWYRMFAGHSSIEAKQQPNSHFTIYLSTGVGAAGAAANGSYVEFLPSGDSLRSYAAPNGLPTDVHEMWLTGPDEESPATAHLFGVASEVTDLSPISGPANAPVGWHWLFRASPTDTAEVAWSALDHYSITDCVLPFAQTGGDFDHPNSIDFDLDSNYIVSFRNLSAIVKIDYNTGATIWQLGGTHNQFQFINDPQATALGGTSGQHSVRVLPNGHFLIYDNGVLQLPPHSRAVEYAVDETRKTATMVWQYQPMPPIFTVAVGSVQRLANGHTLVGFGFAGQLHEADAAGNLFASANFSLNGSSQFYRATRLQSLYMYSPENH